MYRATSLKDSTCILFWQAAAASAVWGVSTLSLWTGQGTGDLGCQRRAVSPILHNPAKNLWQTQVTLSTAPKKSLTHLSSQNQWTPN